MRRKKKEWGAIKIVKTRKDHVCECCDAPIPKGAKALINYGFEYDGGYFRYYFHLAHENQCYGTLMDVFSILPNSEEGQMIMDAVKGGGG